jgi:hypothetical protein
MRTARIFAALFLTTSALGTASCVSSPESTVDEPREVREELSANDAEPTGEAAQPAYESTFHFAVVVPDDGKDEAGGWQKATATLKFGDWRHPFSPNLWQCPIAVGMPLRAKLQGRISPQYAAQITAEITTEATESVMHSRDRWLGEEYCRELYRQMQQMFRGPRYRIGATVARL